ncbi:hypothetical protein R6Z07F_019285 [Ovis aries]
MKTPYLALFPPPLRTTVLGSAQDRATDSTLNSKSCSSKIKKLKLSERNDLLEGTQLGGGGAWIFCPWALWSSCRELLMTPSCPFPGDGPSA